jgi:hypothetical protein
MPRHAPRLVAGMPWGGRRGKKGEEGGRRGEKGGEGGRRGKKEIRGSPMGSGNRNEVGLRKPRNKGRPY